MDVLKHIKEEHERFRNLISQIESSEGDKKKELFRELYSEIYGHHEAEEHIIFPMVREKVEGEDKEVVKEMIEEHNLGSYQFSILERTSIENDTWDAKFSVLKEVLDHHMKEEEDEFMPLARKVVPEEKFVEVYDEFENEHEKYKKEKKNQLK